ncbi:MAG: 30S ribosome-binding factor RbfA [Candidatus Pacebacteria bacterium]|nr:30S ribosome-binding factor RbfA [Candidatus Paceibacterota bacterium]
MWRIEKVNSLIKRELNKIILKEIDVFPGTLLTITRAECTDNLYDCRIFVSIMPEENHEEVIALLNRNIFLIQQKLNKVLRMRPVPKIIFKKETKTAEAGRIEELLTEIERKKEGREQD